jgi:uncharacterized protein YlxW (UPF0749 family)
MAETKKLTQEEIDALVLIQNKNKAIVEEFGKIEIIQLDLDDRRERAENFLKQLRAEEDSTARTLEDKYGKGTVNMDKGEFTALGK